MHALESSQSYSVKHDGASVGGGVGAGVPAGVGAFVGGEVGSHTQSPKLQCEEHSSPKHSSPFNTTLKQTPFEHSSPVHWLPSSQKLSVKTHWKSTQVSSVH